MASDGTIFDINDADDYTKEEIDAMMLNKADVGLSYTKSEEEALLDQKANTSAVEAGLATKADITSVYTKSETDTLLDSKADDGDSYTKAEEDSLLADKADVGVSYTKTEADALLAYKADVGDSYTKAEDDALLADKADSTDVYTKAEVDALIAGIGGNMLALDFANPLYSFSSTNLTYTATEDCYLFGNISTAGTTATDSAYTLSIEGVELSHAFIPGTVTKSTFGAFIGPIKLVAGQTVTITLSSNVYCNLHVFKEV